MRKEERKTSTRRTPRRAMERKPTRQRKEEKKEDKSEVLTVGEEVYLPGTDVILEKGDKIRVTPKKKQ